MLRYTQYCAANCQPNEHDCTGFADTLLCQVLQVPEGQRVNRATLAIFKFESGAVGSLNHTLLLHGSNFATELNIYGDGLHIIVKDPYQQPAVLIRRPHSNDYEEVRSPVASSWQATIALLATEVNSAGITGLPGPRIVLQR